MNRKVLVVCCGVAAIAAGCLSCLGAVPSGGNTVVVNPSVKDGFCGGKLRFNGATDKAPTSYKAGETMKFTFTVQYNQEMPAGRELFVKWTRRGDDGISKHGFERITEEKPVVVETSIDRPGFVNVNAQLTDLSGANWCWFPDDYNRVPLSFEGSAGADVDKLVPAYEEPVDFDVYWQKALAELAAVPVKATLVDVPTNKLPKSHQTTHIAQAFSVTCAGPRPVTGFVVIPKEAKAKSLPVRITFDGYGEGGQGNPPPEWMFSSLPCPQIKMYVNAHGYELLREKQYYKDFFARIPSYAFSCKENEKAETSYFRYMALRLVRAYDWAKTLPQWNGRDLVANGGSQGGLQSIWAASLVKGLTEAYPDVPWCCDVNGPSIGRINGWRPDYRPGLGYYDSVFHGRRIPATCSVSVNRAGLGDYVCPPSGVACFYNAMKCPKRIVWWQNSTHLWVTPKVIRRCWTNEAPAGCAITGVATGEKTVFEGPFVKAAFAKDKWMRDVGRGWQVWDFSKRRHLGAKAMMSVRVKGELVAEADGWAALGTGVDWWWECSVNGKKVFGRPKSVGCNDKGSFEKTDWIYRVPVKKGANEVVFDIIAGEAGYGEVAALDPKDVLGTDLGAEADYFAKTAAFPPPESVPFEPKWLDATHVFFKTAQALPAGIEIKYPREKNWLQFWDDGASTEHVVELPSVDTGDFEYRRVQWSFSGGSGFEIVR